MLLSQLTAGVKELLVGSRELQLQTAGAVRSIEAAESDSLLALPPLSEASKKQQCSLAAAAGGRDGGDDTKVASASLPPQPQPPPASSPPAVQELTKQQRATLRPTIRADAKAAKSKAKLDKRKKQYEDALVADEYGWVHPE